MKKTLSAFLLITCSVIVSSAQVAINTNGNAPNASAMLDVASNNKGLLIPRVYLQTPVDGTTIPSPATSLLVWNTNANFTKGAGFYFNNGTPASPNWQPMLDITLPFYKGTSATGSAFTVENFSQNPASTAIKASAGGAGNALETSGGVKIAGSGQSPAVGKVLTSDANGNATWQGAIAFKATGIKGGGSETVAHNTEKKVPFRYVLYDLTNSFIDAFSSPHSTFTAPVNGIYRFDTKVQFLNPPDCRMWLSVKCKRNGSEWTILDGFEKDNFEVSCGGEVQLQAGDQIFVTIRHNAGSTIGLTAWDNDYLNSYFTGRLVVKL